MSRRSRASCRADRVHVRRGDGVELDAEVSGLGGPDEGVLGQRPSDAAASAAGATMYDAFATCAPGPAWLGSRWYVPSGSTAVGEQPRLGRRRSEPHRARARPTWCPGRRCTCRPRRRSRARSARSMPSRPGRRGGCPAQPSTSSSSAGLAVRVGVPCRPGARPRRLDLGIGPSRHRQQLVDVLGVVGQRVEDERQRRREPHTGLAPDLAAQHALGRLERRRLTRRSGLVAAENRVEDRRVVQIPGQPNVGDRDHAQPWILDVHLERGGDDLLDPPGQLRPRRRPSVQPSDLALPQRSVQIVVVEHPVPRDSTSTSGRAATSRSHCSSTSTACWCVDATTATPISARRCRSAARSPRPRHVEAPSQLRHDRTDDGPLLLQRAHVPEQQVDHQRPHHHASRLLAPGRMPRLARVDSPPLRVRSAASRAARMSRSRRRP